MEAGRARGHKMVFVHTLKCSMNITASRPAMHYRDSAPLTDLQAIIPRIGASNTFYGAAVLRQFQLMHVYVLNDPLAITRSRDKLRSLQQLVRKQIPIPVTGFAHSPDDTEELIKMVGGAPLVVKLLEGTQGIGVVLAETNAAAKSVINAFKGLKANILVQEFIKEAQGSDIRCFVIGNKVVAAMQRTAQAGEFRSNVHQGGSAVEAKITPEERKMAIKAAKAMGLKVAGVDIIRSHHGPLVLEINSSPGLEGIEGATGVDIAGLIIEYIEQHVNGGEKDMHG
jgi:ribosomal protein S6--L-glutamate ligase